MPHRVPQRRARRRRAAFGRAQAGGDRVQHRRVRQRRPVDQQREVRGFGPFEDGQVHRRIGLGEDRGAHLGIVQRRGDAVQLQPVFQGIDRTRHVQRQNQRLPTGRLQAIRHRHQRHQRRRQKDAHRAGHPGLSPRGSAPTARGVTSRSSLRRMARS